MGKLQPFLPPALEQAADGLLMGFQTTDHRFQITKDQELTTMDIERWRKEIDEIDEELLRLLNMRARLALKVGSLKRASGIPLRDSEREEYVLRRLQEVNTGPLDQAAVVRLFRRIIRESRRVEAMSVEQGQNSSVSHLNTSTKLRGIA